MASTSSLGAQSKTSTVQVQKFYDSFNSKLQDVRRRIEEAKEEKQLNSIFEDISKARTALTEETESLPSHDRQTHEQHLREVNISLAEKRSLLVPKTKFTFKRKTKSATEQKETASDQLPASFTDQFKDGFSIAPSSTSNHHSIRNMHGKNLSIDSLPDFDIKEGTDLHILDLQDCIVDLRNRGDRRSFLAMQLRNLSRCVILCGSVDGSAMIHDCSDCIISLECRQFRMHSSHSMAVLISTSSVATIEDCQMIVFAPFLLSNKTLPRVQDFDHINTEETSSNWSEMPLIVQKAVLDSLSQSTLNVEALLRTAGLLVKSKS